MHEILNGLNPRGDARLLEALGLRRRGAPCGEEGETSRQSDIVIRRCAPLVAGRVHAHSACDHHWDHHQLRLTDHGDNPMSRRE